jgi:nickel-dependent lactate racemase
MNSIKLPQLDWKGRKNIELLVPDNWQVEICNMAGFNEPALKSARIKSSIAKPDSSASIAELAKSKKEVAIIFDDMSRGTRVDQIVPFVLEALAAAGIPDGKIRFIAALGCHGILSRADFIRKLGRKTVSRFPVYNHNALDSCCVYAGTTRNGIKILANAEVMKCDFKIGIGSIVSHMMAGFGGGSKIILPGITGLGTNEAFHRLYAKLKSEHLGKPMGIGIYEDNPLRGEIEEAAALVGLDFKIDCLCNSWGETTHIFAGNPHEVFLAGAEKAKKHYVSSRSRDNDVVIANICPKVNEPEGGFVHALPSVGDQGGDMVLVCNAPDGHVVHYLLGSFGRKTGAIMGMKFKLPPHLNRLIVFNQYPDPTIIDSFDPADKVFTTNKWDQVLELLANKHPRRKRLKVAVYPNADIQYCRQ